MTVTELTETCHRFDWHPIRWLAINHRKNP